MTEEVDDALDRCRHGKTAAERCAVCDAETIDVRQVEADVDVREVEVDTDSGVSE